MKFDQEDGKEIVYNILMVIKYTLIRLRDIFTKMYKISMGILKKHSKPMVGVLVTLLVAVITYWCWDFVFNWIEQVGSDMVEEQVIVSKIQTVWNGNTRFYLVSGDGRVLHVTMSKYLTAKIGDKEAGMWTEE